MEKPMKPLIDEIEALLSYGFIREDECREVLQRALDVLNQSLTLDEVLEVMDVCQFNSVIGNQDFLIKRPIVDTGELKQALIEKLRGEVVKYECTPKSTMDGESCCEDHW